MRERILRTHMNLKSTSAQRGSDPPMQLQIAVIIPTLNEATELHELIASLANRTDEVVVSDGGSEDATATIARKLGARVVEGPPGRGAQIQRGVEAADADILLVLHADTRLPPGALDAVRTAVQHGAVGGGFLVRFDSPRRLFTIGSHLVNLRTRWSRLPLGDQAQWVTRQAYVAAGGYPNWPILEDLEFVRRLKKVGRVSILPLRVETSARRYVNQGVARTVATNWLIWFLYLLGVRPERLARLYRPHRAPDSGIEKRPRDGMSRGR